MRTLATLSTLLVRLAFVADTKKKFFSTFVAGTLFVFGMVLFLASNTQAHAGDSWKKLVTMGHVPGRGVGAVGNRLGVATAKSLA